MVEEVDPAELEERLASESSVQVIDVRPRAHFERGHIPGSENVPLPHLVSRIDEVEWGDYVVCACPHGESSLQAARLVESYEGLPDDAVVANLEGGLDAWPGDLVSTADADFDRDAPF